MKIIFVTRLHRLDKGRLGFYVPSNIMDYYDLEAGPVKATMAWQPNFSIRDLAVNFYRYNGRLRGTLRQQNIMPDVGTLVQLTLDSAAKTEEMLDMLLAKKRAGDRRSWLEKKGNLADI